MEIDETGQNDPRHLDRRVGRADVLRPGLVARYDAHRAWEVRAERRHEIEVAPWPPRKKATSSFAYPSRAGTLPPSAERFGRKVAVGADVLVRNERPPSSFNSPRCRVQPCPAEDIKCPGPDTEARVFRRWTRST